MKQGMVKRVLVTTAAATALIAGGFTGTTAVAATPARAGSAADADFSVQAVVNLGLSSTQAKYVQCYLKNAGWGYTGAIDGQLGPNSWKAMQRRLAAGYGYDGAIDGSVGPKTVSALQRRLADGYGYTGPIDGIAGSGTQAAFKRYANAQSGWC
jgi:peptidoglycan hydrolase-like protein with peptidoglycan-binding domain